MRNYLIRLLPRVGDAKSLIWVWVSDFCCGHPGPDKPFKPLPGEAASFMAPAPERLEPTPYNLGTKRVCGLSVAGNSIIVKVTIHD